MEPTSEAAFHRPTDVTNIGVSPPVVVVQEPVDVCLVCLCKKNATVNMIPQRVQQTRRA